jgi:5-methylcytosine-specific restriction endonuclease McrA
MAAKPATREDPVLAASHCLIGMPYRMIAYERMNQVTPIYRVAGSAKSGMNARNALKEAFGVHGGNCFYCKQKIAADNLTVDHVEPEALKKNGHLQNLVLAHKRCNLGKGHKPIEAFKPDAGREWLSALLLQVQDRLNRLNDA